MFGTDHLACESYQLIKWNLFIIKTMGDVPEREREREILRGQLWKKDDEEKRQSHDLQQAKGPVSAVFIMLLLFHYKENRWILSHHFFLNRQSLRISELWWLLPFQFNSTVESNKNFSSNTLSLSLPLSLSLSLSLSPSLYF